MPHTKMQNNTLPTDKFLREIQKYLDMIAFAKFTPGKFFVLVKKIQTPDVLKHTGSLYDKRIEILDVKDCVDFVVVGFLLFDETVLGVKAPVSDWIDIYYTSLDEKSIETELNNVLTERKFVVNVEVVVVK